MGACKIYYLFIVSKTFGVLSKCDLLENDSSIKSIIDNRVFVPGGGIF